MKVKGPPERHILILPRRRDSDDKDWFINDVDDAGYLDFYTKTPVPPSSPQARHAYTLSDPYTVEVGEKSSYCKALYDTMSVLLMPEGAVRLWAPHYSRTVFRPYWCEFVKRGCPGDYPECLDRGFDVMDFLFKGVYMTLEERFQTGPVAVQKDFGSDLVSLWSFLLDGSWI